MYFKLRQRYQFISFLIIEVIILNQSYQLLIFLSHKLYFHFNLTVLYLFISDFKIYHLKSFLFLNQSGNYIRQSQNPGVCGREVKEEKAHEFSWMVDIFAPLCVFLTLFSRRLLKWSWSSIQQVPECYYILRSSKKAQGQCVSFSVKANRLRLNCGSSVTFQESIFCLHQ